MLAPVARPFSPEGGLRLLTGNLGHAVIKISAVKPEHHLIEAPAKIFHCQEELADAFNRITSYNVCYTKLLRIFFTARQFSAEEAAAMGLVNRVVPYAELATYRNNFV